MKKVTFIALVVFIAVSTLCAAAKEEPVTVQISETEISETETASREPIRTTDTRDRAVTPAKATVNKRVLVEENITAAAEQSEPELPAEETGSEITVDNDTVAEENDDNTFVNAVYVPSIDAAITGFDIYINPADETNVEDSTAPETELPKPILGFTRPDKAFDVPEEEKAKYAADLSGDETFEIYDMFYVDELKGRYLVIQYTDGCSVKKLVGESRVSAALKGIIFEEGDD